MWEFTSTHELATCDENNCAWLSNLLRQNRILGSCDFVLSIKYMWIRHSKPPAEMNWKVDYRSAVSNLHKTAMSQCSIHSNYFRPQSPCIVENVFEYDTERRKYWICTGLFVARSWKHHFTSESTTRSLFQPELVQNDVFAYRTWMQRLNSFEWVRSRWETILPIRIRQVPMLDMESMH